MELRWTFKIGFVACYEEQPEIHHTCLLFVPRQGPVLFSLFL